MVVEKIKEVELRSRRAQLLMTEIVIELGYSHAPSRHPMLNLNVCYTKGEKEGYWYGRGSGKI